MFDLALVAALELDAAAAPFGPANDTGELRAAADEGEVLADDDVAVLAVSREAQAAAAQGHVHQAPAELVLAGRRVKADIDVERKAARLARRDVLGLGPRGGEQEIVRLARIEGDDDGARGVVGVRRFAHDLSFELIP